ncbi:ABC-three component system protein [Rubrivivax gelatinosus]|uniref:ABC-three component system protein n=1 Tax=Rubrivivax gelatinosus TaxID=28068 RepID=UPI0012FD8A0B|nr:ABC-three component system protein [Rubrivivax gelatinosus]
MLVTNNHFSAAASKSYVALLYERLRLEEAQSGAAMVDAFIEDLQHFLDRPASEVNRTLADKLIASSREDLIPFAEAQKERAMKKIMRFQTSETAQQIFSCVLSDLRNRFLLHVSPLLAANASRAEVDAAMHDKVVAPVAQSMEPSPLSLDPGAVMAMLFYLAGNCHIKWD